MKILLKPLCLFCIVFQQAFAATNPPNPLDDIANQALSGISEGERIKIRNLELEMQMAKQRRINAEMTYKTIQLEEKIVDLSKSLKTNQSDILHYQQLLSADATVAKNKTLTKLVDKKEQQLSEQQKLADDLNVQNAQLKQQVAELTKALDAQSLKGNSAEQKNSNTENQALAALVEKQQQQLTEKEAFIASLEKDNKQQLANIESLSLANGSEIDQSKQQAQIDAQNRRYELLSTQFQELQAASATLKDAINKAKQQNDNLVQQNQILTTKVKAKDKQITKSQQKAKFDQAQFKGAPDKNTETSQNYQSEEADADLEEQYADLGDDTSSPNDAKSQFKLANEYRANQNYEMALYWYLQVAEKGYASAQFNIGNMYYNGLGVEKDVAQAFSFYLQSAEQGFVEAEYNVGLMYASGEGVLKDEVQSFYWYTKAAEQGHQKAQKALAKIRNNS